MTVRINLLPQTRPRSRPVAGLRLLAVALATAVVAGGLLAHILLSRELHTLGQRLANAQHDVERLTARLAEAETVAAAEQDLAARRQALADLQTRQVADLVLAVRARVPLGVTLSNLVVADDRLELTGTAVDLGQAADFVLGLLQLSAVYHVAVHEVQAVGAGELQFKLTAFLVAEMGGQAP